MRKIDIMAMGHRLKEVRTRNGMTQEDLVELAGIDPKTVYRLENGRVMMRLDNLVRIAEILDVTLDYLVYGRTDRDPLTDVLDEFSPNVWERIARGLEMILHSVM